jgi:hypothetical protein
VYKKCQRERKICRGSRMGAWHQDWLADWLSVVIWFRLRLRRLLFKHHVIIDSDMLWKCLSPFNFFSLPSPFNFFSLSLFIFLNTYSFFLLSVWHVVKLCLFLLIWAGTALTVLPPWGTDREHAWEVEIWEKTKLAWLLFSVVRLIYCATRLA